MVDSTLNAVVRERHEITPELIVMRVRPVDWDLPAFTPGQFAVLGLPGSARRHPLADPEDETPDPGKLIRRSYSIASSSVSTEYLEFFVTLVRSGCLTPRLFALEPGDHVWLGPKITGTFTLGSIPEEKHLVLVATGTGLAPYMSMLRTEIPETGRKVSVLLGARHSWDLGYRSELTEIVTRAPNISFIPTISRPGEEREPWAGRVGYVQDLWKGGIVAEHWGFAPGPENAHVLLCGNPAMIGDMQTLLEGEGFKLHKKRDPGNIHFEKYW